MAVQKNTINMDIPDVHTLDQVLEKIQDDMDINNIIDSITFNVKSRTIIINIQKLVKKAAEELAEHHKEVEDDMMEEKIKKLSNCYTEKYPELLNLFDHWKPEREKLIKLLSNSADKLDRNSSFVSCFRILTSAADIFGTLARGDGQPQDSWADFAMQNASTIGIMSLFVELMFSKKIFSDIKKVMKKDHEISSKIVEWFKQTEDLDATIKSFFPYGIDSDIVNKINKCTPGYDDYNKIFMSIVASNVRRNVKLFKNKEFLEKADRIAESEAGKQWFHKIILENDPHFNHYLNCNLNDEIQELLKTSPDVSHEMYVQAGRMLSNKIKMKVVLNLMTIISAGSNLLFESNQEQVDTLRELSEQTKNELEQIQKMVLDLKPSGFQ